MYCTYVLYMETYSTSHQKWIETNIGVIIYFSPENDNI